MLAPELRLKPIFIVGPTGVGKTGAAIRVAQEFNGQIVGLDTRTIYKEMNIGVAKDTPDERAAVPHHLYDLFTVGEAPKIIDLAANLTDLLTYLGSRALGSIRAHNALPLFVGGSPFLYESMLQGYQFRRLQPEEHNHLESRSLETLQLDYDYLYGLPFNADSRPNLLSYAERQDAIVGTNPMRNALTVGMQMHDRTLEKRIRARTDAMLEQGLEEEVRDLTARYPKPPTETDGFPWARPFYSVGYREWFPYFNGDTRSLNSVVKNINQNTMALAAWQQTRFESYLDVHWVDSPEQVVEMVAAHLSEQPRESAQDRYLAQNPRS